MVYLKWEFRCVISVNGILLKKNVKVVEKILVFGYLDLGDIFEMSLFCFCFSLFCYVVWNVILKWDLFFFLEEWWKINGDNEIIYYKEIKIFVFLVLMFVNSV